MNRRALFLASLMLFTVLLSACASKGGSNDFSVHNSSQGLTPEAYIPGDVAFMVSYSLKAESQFDALKALETRLGDEGRISRTISEQLDTQLTESGLNYENDLAPAFGEQFRVVFAANTASLDGEAFSVVTLEDPKKMKSTLDALVDAGDLEFKKLSKVEAYVSEVDQFYAGLQDDLFLVANTAENLVNMVNQNEKDSLWKSELYQDGLADVGSDHLLFGMIFPSLLAQEAVEDVIDRQSLVVRAQEEGFDFDVYIQANKEKADANGFSFDGSPRSKAYLFKEVPAEGLIAYFESFGLQQTFEQAAGLDSLDSFAQVDKSFQNYFGMNFSEDVLSFMDKGFAFALHGNGQGIVPGLTLLVDVSSDTSSAQAFMEQLDSQLDSLLGLLEVAFPGAVTKGTQTLNGKEFSHLAIDLNSVEGFNTSQAPLPAAVTSSVLQLNYGLDGDRLLITTAEVWESGDAVSIASSDLYKTLSSKLEGSDEGLILLDAQGLATFLGSLRALREQLQLGVSEGSLAFEELLDGFTGLISASDTKAYESHFGGFLMLAE